MTRVPNFALYGTDAQPQGLPLVHHELIPERSSRFNWEIEPHLHDGLIQVLYAVRGEGEAVIDGRRWRLRTPCLIVAPARSVHGFHFMPDIDGPVVSAAQRPLESLATAAAPELLPWIRTPAVVAVDPASRHAEALPPLFEAIAREASTHMPGQVAAGMALLLALFVQIARVGHGAPPGEAASRSRKSLQVERFRSLLDERCRSRPTVAACAAVMGITAGQLTRLCHEMMGQSALAAINARVLHEAQRELVYSSLGIKQIAAELGFEDEAYFGRFFKKHTGARPSDFRALARSRLATG